MNRIIRTALTAFGNLSRREKLEMLISVIESRDLYGADYADLFDAIGYNTMAPALDIDRLKEALWLRGYALMPRQELYKLQNAAWQQDETPAHQDIK